MFLEILTPEKTIFAGEIISAKFKGTDGIFEILKNHAPFISTIEPGNAKIKDSTGYVWNLNLGNGLVDVQRNKIKVLVEY